MPPKKKQRPAPKRETDLYPPIRDYLTAQGYTVRAEVSGCDCTAEKDGALIVIELKLRFNLELLLQAADRQRISDSVYVAIPRPDNMGRKSPWRQHKHVLRRLEIGLLLVSFDTDPAQVQVVFHPVPFARKKQSKKKRAILRERAGRSQDLNEGGSVGKKLVTAYREQALFIACALEHLGEASPKTLRDLGASKKAQAILYDNHYGWFERVGRARYALKPKGREALDAYPQLTGPFKKQIKELEDKA